MKTPNYYMAAIGYSVGGIDALKEFIATLPTKTDNLAILIRPQTNPAYENYLVELLARNTNWEVMQAKNRAEIQPGLIYVLPPSHQSTVKDGKIWLKKSHSTQLVIDELFTSVALAYKAKAIGLLFSVTKGDGVAGIKAIKSNGGFTLVEEPHENHTNGQPLAEPDAQAVDLVTKPVDMYAAINYYIRYGKIKYNQVKVSEPAMKDAGSKLLKQLSVHCGIDFSHYKTSMIIRRMERRIAQVQLPGLDEYLAYTEQHPEELDHLYKKFLIGVSSFFRDKEVFTLLGQKLTDIVSQKKKAEAIRIWIPGCATGEEAYTIAIMLREIIEQTNNESSVHIFASDIDENALAKARKGIYEADELKNLDKHLLEKYFTQTGRTFAVSKSVRAMILFSKHDVTSDPPFLKLDLISCRNLLIYFTQKLQSQVISTFHYALNKEGILLLGKSETVGSHSMLFLLLHPKHKLYAKKAALVHRNTPQKITMGKFAGKNSAAIAAENISIEELLKESIYEQFDSPYIVVNAKMDMVRVQGEVFPYISIRQGEMTLNVVKNAHPKLQMELRSLLSTCLETNKKNAGNIKRIEQAGGDLYVRLKIYPLSKGESSQRLYFLVFETINPNDFLSVPHPQIQQTEGRQHLRMVELEIELDETKEHLQTFIEELETNNEELQSLNEELQSANEEFQATNEELITSNEELQGANEEIITNLNELRKLNTTLEDKEAQLSVNLERFDLLLQNSKQAYILLKEDYRIVVFNAEAQRVTKLINNKPLKEGENLIDLVIPEAVEGFVSKIEASLQGRSDSSERQVNIHQEMFFFRIQYIPVRGVKNTIDHVLLSYEDITESKKADLEIQEKTKQIQEIFESITDAFVSLNDDWCYTYMNKKAGEIFNCDPEKIIGKHIWTEFPEGIDQPFYHAYHQAMEEKKYIYLTEYYPPYDRWFENHIYPSANGLSIFFRDITEQKKAEEEIRMAHQRLSSHLNNSPLAVVEWDRNMVLHTWSPQAENIFGWSASEVIGKRADEFNLVYPADADAVKSTVAQLMSGAVNGIKNTNRGYTKSGQVIYCEFHSSVLTDENGEVVSLMTLVQDVTASKQAAEALRQSNARLSRIFESNMIGFLFWNASGEITSANDRYLDMVGYTQEDLAQGKIDWKNITPEEYAPLDVQGLEQIHLTGVCKPFEKEYIRKDGSRFPILIGGASLQDDNTSQGVAFVMDMSELKKAQAEILKREKKFRAMIENSVDAFVLLDEKLSLIYRSPSAERITGWTNEELMNIGRPEQTHPDDVEKMLHGIKTVLANPGKPYQLTFRLLHKAGHYVWAEGTMMNLLHDENIRAIVSNIQDVTERKKAEAEIIKRENKFRAMIEHSLDVFALLDKNFMNIYRSPSAVKITGWTDEDRMTVSGTDQVHPDDVESMRSLMKNVLTNPGQPYQLSFRSIHKSGHYVWLEGVATNMLHDESIQAIVTNIQDITERKKAEAEIVKREKKFRAMIENSTDAFVLLDEKLSIIYRSPSAERITGWTNEEQMNVGRPESHPDDVDTMLHGIKNVLANPGKPYQLTFRMLHKAGHYIWAEVTLTNLLHDENIRAIVSNIQDVTERKKTEEKIVKEKELSDSIINSLPGIFYLYDHEGNFLRWNTNFEIVSGYTAEEVGQMHPLDFFDTDEKDLLQQRIDKVFAEGVADVEAHFLTKDHQKIPYYFNGWAANFEGKPCLIGMGIDISERKAANEALQQSEANLRTIFDHSDTGYVLLNTELKVISFNQSALLFAQENLQKTLLKNASGFDYITSESRELLTKELKNALKGKNFTFEKNYPQTDGTDRWYYIRILPVSDSKNKVIGLIMAVSNFTERKLAELHRNKITSDLIQRNKDLEQFTYIISHNLRAPVANISGFTDVIQIPELPDITKQELIQGLSISVKKLEDVITDLNTILQVKREINEKKVLVNFSELVADIQFSIRNLVQEENVLIKTDFTQVNQMPIIRSYLYSILYNLISNSIKYRRVGIAPVIEITSQRTDDKHITILYYDNGRGIDLEKKGDKVFGLYKRFHPEIEGKGMGLFMVKTQVETLGGTISIESTVDKGTSFTINFVI
ncbi:MAG: PAS domain S-box protein [Bacteroidota bacterium]